MPKNKNVKIDYTARDFDKIKKELVDYAQRYYPDNYRDFSTPSFGSMVLDSVSYIGDVLSYYLDYSVNESFLDTSIEFDNIRKHARSLGYNFSGVASSYGIVSLFVIVPSNADGTAPDFQYAPILRAGSSFTSLNGGNFILSEDVDFSHEKNDVVAARFDGTTGQTTFYAIRAYGQVESGLIQVATADLRNQGYVKFKKVRVGPSTITDILRVVDTDGNIYYQVDNLSQETIFIETTNKDAQNDGVRSILKPFSVSRRFTVERDDLGTYLQFGFGVQDEDTDGIVEPSKIALKMHGKNYISNTSFDPSKLMQTNKLGISPSNTILRITYRTNSQNTNNASANSIRTISNKAMDFKEPLILVNSKAQAVLDSLEVTNDEPLYTVNNDQSLEELKQRAKGYYSSQSRAVTKQDYESLVYNMPKKFGAIKRANIINPSSNPDRKMKLYVIGEDNNDNLAPAHMIIKRNLKNWLARYKSINDSLEIYDAKVINFKLSFVATGDKRFSSTFSYNACIEALTKLFSETFYIGEPLYISRIYQTLNKLDSITDVISVDIGPVSGGIYSSTSVNFSSILSSDGTYYKAPKNCIFELRYPNNDIKGSIV
jgi:hypothetical protein